MRETSWAQSRYLRFEVCGDKVGVYLKDIALLKRLNLRKEEAVRLIRRHLGRVGGLVYFGLDMKIAVFARYSLENVALQLIVGRLDSRLDEILNRPLPPKRLQTLLGISSQERLRWTKDGRLPRSGVIKFRRGGVISISTYPVDRIIQLIDTPSFIEKWRQEDRVSDVSKCDAFNSGVDPGRADFIIR